MELLSKFFGGGFDELSQVIIRPPRDIYHDDDLGPEKFSLYGKNYKRSDITIYNQKNLKLNCSWWEPFDEEREFDQLPCVIYLHGNSSSKAEATIEAKIFLPMNVTLFAFDFAGCGKSEGDYISLGWYEKYDVKCVVEFLRKTNKVSTIGLWGRSMGAVTALMYGDEDPTVAGLVLDSPFSSLKLLVEEIVKDKISLPNFVLNQAISMVKSSVQKKAGFSLDEIEPINYAKRCFIPALFVSAQGDNFVKPHHSKLLYDVYQGDKNIVNIEGDHNSIRPKFFKDSAGIFFYNALRVAEISTKIFNKNNTIENNETSVLNTQSNSNNLNTLPNKDNKNNKENDNEINCKPSRGNSNVNSSNLNILNKNSSKSPIRQGMTNNNFSIDINSLNQSPLKKQETYTTSTNK